MSRQHRDLLLLALGSAVLFGLRLGARDLWNPNEPIYGEAVVEMAQRADWLLPHVNGLVFAEKPILFFWLALLASKVMGGVSEAALRLPACLAGIATVLGTYVIARPYGGRARALASSLAAATLFGLFWNARCVQMDILVTASTLWVLIALTRVLDHGAKPVPGFVMAGAVAGLGFAAKGPVALICPGLTFGAYLVATRRWREVTAWPVLAGVTAFVCVAAPWFWSLHAEGQDGVIEEVLFRQNVVRFIHPWDHQAPWWYFLGSFWVDMAPWAFFVPFAAGVKRRNEGERRLALLSAIWIVVVVLFFSFSKSKRSPYVLPIAPAVALLAGEVAVTWVTGRWDAARRGWLAAMMSAIGAVFVVAGVTIAVGALVRLDRTAAVPVAVLGVVAIIAGALVVADVARARTRPQAPLSLALATAVIYVAAGGVALPALNAYKSARPLCEQIERIAGPEVQISSYGFWKWRSEYRFYLRRPITNLTSPGALREAWTGPRRVVLLVEADKLSDVRQVIGEAPPTLAGRVGSAAISVFTNR